MSIEEETDGYDPVVDDRFKLLDHLPTPPLLADHRPAAPVASIGASNTGARRSVYALATAAAIIVVAGLSFVALSGGEGDQGVQASDLTENGDRNGATDDSGQNTDPGRGPSELTVSVTTQRADDGRAETASRSDEVAEDRGGAEGDEGGEPAEADGGSSAESNGQSGSDDSDGGAGSSDGTTTTTASAGGTGDDGDDTGPDGGATTTTTEKNKADTSWPISTPETNPRPTMPPISEGDGGPKTTDGSPDDDPIELITIRGTITEVFTDCQSRLVLNESNQVENVGPVSCDGGSHIVVSGSRIQTSAGYVPADAYYDKHSSDLKPGQSVSVTARKHDGGWLSLNCERCEIR